MTPFNPGAVIPVRSARTFEARFLEALPPWKLGQERAIQVVVPSESLRRHWIATIARSRGTLLGVEVMTHPQWVRSLLLEVEDHSASRKAWAGHRARILSAEEPVLMRALGRFEDGLSHAAKVAVELVDAGFDAAHADAILEATQDWPRSKKVSVGSMVAPRVAAIVRVAKRLVEEAEEQRGGLQALAVERVVAHIKTPGVVSQRPIFILGFADATSRVADLIEAARAHLGAVVAVPMPTCPTRPNEPDVGVGFAADFHSRFSGLFDEPVCSADPTPVTEWIQAADPWDEAERVSSMVASLLSAGVAPERIGVVVRQSESWGPPIRRAFAGAGIPFSGVGARGHGGARERRVKAALAVLREGPAVSPSVWAVAIGEEAQSLKFLAFDALGCRTLDGLCQAMKAAPGTVRLKAVNKVAWREGRAVRERAKLTEGNVDFLRDRSQKVMDIFDAWPEVAPAAEHWKAIGRLLQGGLGFDSDSPLVNQLRGLVRQLDGAQPIERAEAVRVFLESAEEHATAPVGGEGGGVAFLDAIEARGRTFDHVFVMGMNRGVFPRPVVEDPILPDAARAALKTFLRDLRTKRIGSLEERFLFAHLMDCAKTVTLSCAQLDAAGAHAHPSSFLVELRLAGRVGEPLEVDLPPRRAWAVAVDEALSGADVATVMARGGASAPLAGLLMHRLDGRREQGPFLGEIGPVQLEHDPRQGAQFVTTYEAIARCPWQAFLTKFLGVARRPDPHGPLASVDNYLLGRVVHDVVERVVVAALDGREGLTPADAVAIQWPSDATLKAWCHESAVLRLMEDGVSWSGLAKAAVGRAMRAVHIVRALDEQVGLDGVWGVEREFSVQTSQGREVHFRVDRLDVLDGRVSLTDFKVGKPKADFKKEDTRRKHTLNGVREGELLQGALYSRAYDGAVGQYLYVNPLKDYEHRVLQVEADDLDVQACADAVIDEIDQVVTTGTFFPRVAALKSSTTPWCEFCEVREACVRDDSTLKRQFLEALDSTAVTPTQRARRQLWTMGRDDE